MFLVITGGSGSGKSAYAEQCVLDCGPAERIYIATMYPFDEECDRRIRRHREMRRQKQFSTLECYTGLKTADIPEDSVVLLECMSNLVANEMFGSEQHGDTDHGIDSGIAGTVSDRILKEIAELSGKVDHFVIVSNNVFEDGIDYEESTRNYIRELGHVNAGLAAMADTVVEVVVGIPVFIKQ